MALCRVLPFLRSAAHRIPLNLLPSRAYWGRSDIFSEVSSMLQTMDRRMREMDRDMCRIMEEMERSSPIRLPRLLSPWSFGRTRDVPVEVSTKDGRKYQLQLEMPDMRPEDITVTLKDHSLKISAKKDVKKPDGSRYFHEFTHEYTLPSEVNPESVKSMLSDGVLTIEAPLPALEEPVDSEKPTEIPINVDTGDKKDSSPP